MKEPQRMQKGQAACRLTGTTHEIRVFFILPPPAVPVLSGVQNAPPCGVKRNVILRPPDLIYAVHSIPFFILFRFYSCRCGRCILQLFTNHRTFQFCLTDFSVCATLAAFYCSFTPLADPEVFLFSERTRTAHCAVYMINGKDLIFK